MCGGKEYIRTLYFLLNLAESKSVLRNNVYLKKKHNKVNVTVLIFKVRNLLALKPYFFQQYPNRS